MNSEKSKRIALLEHELSVWKRLAEDLAEKMEGNPVKPVAFWTSKQAARMMQVSRRTLLKIAEAENIPCFLFGGDLRFPQKEFLEWVIRAKGNRHVLAIVRRRSKMSKAA